MGTCFQELRHFCPYVIILVENYQILGMKVVLVFYGLMKLFPWIYSFNYGRK